MSAQFTSADREPDLYQRAVSIDTPSGAVQLNAVFLDTKPEGSARGTVVFAHGAPGSHKDFKYITPKLVEKDIRVIGINFPGMGYTSYDDRLQETNEERVQLVQGIVDALDLRTNLIFAAHSRGSENAIRMGALNRKGTEAVILMNPIGLRPHRALRPLAVTQFLAWLWKLNLTLQVFLAPIYKLVYDLFALKVKTGKMAGTCLSLMANSDFASQMPFIEAINESTMKMVVAYSGNDPIVEPPINQELLQAFRDSKELTCSTLGDEPEITAKALHQLQSGTKSLGLFFTKEGHFLQKHRAELIAAIIDEVFAKFDLRLVPNILQPVAWLVGIWRSEHGGKALFPTIPKFTYGEEIQFSLSDPHMNASKALNYTAFAWSVNDNEELHSENGYLTIRDGSKQAALTTVMNNGFVTVEEGPAGGSRLKLRLVDIGRISFSRDLPVHDMVREWSLINSNTLQSRLDMETLTHGMREHTSITYTKIFP
ncbi:Protein C15F1.1 [Aphelenchoides avenae]|nr:Protein C15F1.1 [Aphelenchus avenae]